MIHNSNILFLSPAPVRYTREEAQAEMGMTFDRIERAAQLCAADHDLTATPVVLGATLHESYFGRMLYQDVHAFENACVVFLPEALAHHAPALAHATGSGTWTEWNESETVCTAYWSRQCPNLGGRALSTDTDLPLQFWIELDSEQTTFLPQTLDGPSLIHTLFVTHDEVWVSAQWLHLDNFVRFNNAAGQARNMTARMAQHVQDCVQHDDGTPWMQGIYPMQLHRTQDQLERTVNVMGCRLHHVYGV